MDKDVSEVVKEKILSYTNAYITKLEVTELDRKDGMVVVEAKVTVRVAPLVKVLRDANIPTIAFDTATAIGQVEIAAKEKANAIDLYADLLRRSDDLQGERRGDQERENKVSTDRDATRAIAGAGFSNTSQQVGAGQVMQCNGLRHVVRDEQRNLVL